MNKLTNKKNFIGIDISKDVLDVSFIGPETKVGFQDLKVKNDISGFEKVTSWLTKLGKPLNDCLFCMEHTGTYGLLFFAWLAQKEIDFCVEPGLQIKRSLGITRGKNDKVDARRIADYARTHREKLKTFELPTNLILQLKQLLTYREQCVKMRTSLKNSLKHHLQYQQVSGLTSISERISMQIHEQDQIVADIEKQILEVIESDAQAKKNLELARSVKGIGLIIAAFMLVSTNNFSSFENGRKYACFAGIAPFENVSGSSIRGKTRVSHLGNRTIKTLLSNGANSAAKWDPQLRKYYQRKQQEGKDHKLIMNAIANKLIHRVFAVVNRQSPYVQIFEHNF